MIQTVISAVGAGGKTSYLLALARRYAAQGRRVVFTTSTHIQRLPDEPGVRVLGVPSEDEHKLASPFIGNSLDSIRPQFRSSLKAADVILIEADGARGYPLKLPRAHEPVILQETQTVYGVAGMTAIGRRWEEACFAFDRALQEKICGADPAADERKSVLPNAAIIRKEDVAGILLSRYGTRKDVGARCYRVILNQCDGPEEVRNALWIRDALAERGMTKEDVLLCRHGMILEEQ
jgi:probable selenium-dependent hydroxylase accessory protein YqeC